MSLVTPRKGYKSVKVIPRFVNFIEIPEEWEITFLSELSVEIMRRFLMGFSNYNASDYD